MLFHSCPDRPRCPERRHIILVVLAVAHQNRITSENVGKSIGIVSILKNGDFYNKLGTRTLKTSLVLCEEVIQIVTDE